MEVTRPFSGSARVPFPEGSGRFRKTWTMGRLGTRVHQIPDVFEKFLFCVWPYTCCVSLQKRSL